MEQLTRNNWHFFPNEIIGKKFTLTRSEGIMSLNGPVSLSAGTEIRCLSFDIDGYMVAEFNLYGTDLIGHFHTGKLVFSDKLSNDFLFKKVKLKETPVLYSDFLEEMEDTENCTFYVASIFKKDGEEYAYLILYEENGDISYNISTVSKLSNLIITD